MSQLLEVYRAKPNPVGKDRNRLGPKPEQLVAEWVDIKNIGTEGVPFVGMDLHHLTFGHSCSNITGTESYWMSQQGQGILSPGQILRVHTGSKSYEGKLSAEDRGPDVNWTAFAERENFVLNNVCGDRITIFWSNNLRQQQSDWAGYSRNPPEGVILYRQADRTLRPIPVRIH